VKTNIILVADLAGKLPRGTRRITLHVAERSAYLRIHREYVRAAYLRLAKSLATCDEVVVWSCDAWAQKVALSMICAFSSQKPRPPHITIIDLPLQARLEGTWCGSPEIPRNASQARALIPRPLTSSEVLEGSNLWTHFVARDPAKFLGGGSGVVANVDALFTFYRELFPRRRSGVLRLSRFDDLLLSAARESLVPTDVVVGRSAEFVMLRRWLSCVGDVFIARRLREWSEHPRGAPALVASSMDASGSMFRVRYGLTASGRSMLEDRLQKLGDAPLLRVGGTAAYDPAWPHELQDDEA
jgi:hypothetical protein